MQRRRIGADQYPATTAGAGDRNTHNPAGERDLFGGAIGGHQRLRNWSNDSLHGGWIKRDDIIADLLGADYGGCGDDGAGHGDGIR